MAKYETKLTFDELKIFYKKKKCPHCGSRNMSRHFHKKFSRTDRGLRGMNNIGLENYYETTPIYTCEECNRSYTLSGLLSGETIEENIEGENKESIRNRDIEVSEKNVKPVSRIFGLISSGMILMIVGGSIAEQDINILLVFGPFVLLFTAVWVMLIRMRSKKR